MIRIGLLLLLIGAFISHVAAESVPTFCKCTCFKNSTIVRLGPKDSSEDDTSPALSSQLFLRSLNPFTTVSQFDRRAASSSCTQCTRAFCLNYNLPICKDAEEKDVVTMCFQRDSRKDQIIVWAFILGTTGLLGWAALKRLQEIREGRKTASFGPPNSGDRRQQVGGDYVPVGVSRR